MDKNKEQKNNKQTENKPGQDSFRPWLKLLPAAAVFAAVCITCYQADKSPAESVQVTDSNIMSTDDIKKMILAEDLTEKTTATSAKGRQKFCQKDIIQKKPVR